MAVFVALVIIMVFVLATVVISHNRFVDERQTITNSWSNVETELQRRHDLIPNLVTTVKGYASHERSTLEQVMAARNNAQAVSGRADDHIGPETQLVQGLRQLFAVSEAYPDLRANEQFRKLSDQLTSTENRLQAARRVYNGNVREYNRRIESIPSNLIARVFGFVASSYFELEPLARDAGVPVAKF